MMKQQSQLLAKECQLLALQLAYHHPLPSLTGLPQGREDQLQARLLCEKNAELPWLAADFPERHVLTGWSCVSPWLKFGLYYTKK